MQTSVPTSLKTQGRLDVTYECRLAVCSTDISADPRAQTNAVSHAGLDFVSGS